MCILCNCFLIFWIKKKRRATAGRYPMMALSFYLPKVKIRHFSYAEAPCRSTKKIILYLCYAKKSTQEISLPILNPNSCTLGSGEKGSVGKIPPLPGNSTCMGGHNFCSPCYTCGGRPRPGRKLIPVATSCSGS